MNEEKLYDFCLDWQMGYLPKEWLIKEFKSFGISFNEFETFTRARKWFTTSMKVLKT